MFRSIITGSGSYIPPIVQPNRDFIQHVFYSGDQKSLTNSQHEIVEKLVKRFFKLYGRSQVPEHIMPMSIHWLGNSSVATIPSLYDLVRKEQLEHHTIK